MSKVLFVSCVLAVLLLVEGLPYAEKPIFSAASKDKVDKVGTSAPKITYSKETRTKAGLPIQLDCAVEGVDLSGVPLFKVKWSKVVKNKDAELETTTPISSNDKLLMLTEKIEIYHPVDTYQYSLKVKETDEEDTGIYRCTVDFGENQRIDADVDVLIEKPAYFADTEPKLVKVTEGDAISIDCQPGGSPTPRVYWERVGDEIPYYGGSLVQTNQFDLPLIHRSHAGSYRCYADNGLSAPVQSEIFVEVDYKPVVDTKEKEMVASFYDEVKLVCSAEAHPLPQMIWLKDGATVHTSSNNRIENQRSLEQNLVTSTFTILEAQAEDFAKYTCAAANELGSAINEVYLKMKTPPVIEKQSRGEKIFEIESPYDKARTELPVALECEASGTPTPTYRWTKDGESLIWQADPRMSLEYGTGTLLIRNPKQTDNGKYQCFAYNDLGVAFSEEIVLKNSTSLEFVRKEPGAVTHEAELGRPYRLACPEAVGHPKPSLTWMKSRDVEGGMEMEYITSDRTVQDEEGTLWITHVTEEDDTELNKFKYVCLAASELYPQDISLAKTVSLKTINPIDGELNANNDLVNIESFAMFTSDHEVTFTAGQDHSLWCIFGGEPVPQVSWSRTDGKDIDITRTFIKNGGQTLVFKNTAALDAGEYQCMADNRVGHPKIHKLFVDVQTPPEISPDFRDQAKVVPEGTTVTFSCALFAGELDDPTFEWYFNSRPIEVVDGSKREIEGSNLSVRSVTKADIGNYACRASNKAGTAYGQTTLNVIPQKAKSTEGDSVKAIREEIDGLRNEVQRLSQLIELKISTPVENPKLDRLLQEVVALLKKDDTETVHPQPSSFKPTPTQVKRGGV